MTETGWLNIIVWLIDTSLILTILFGYFFFTRFYNQWQVWPINSSHDNISSSEWAKVIKTYQHQFKLADYQIDFITDKNYRLFSNLHRRSKRIILTARIFPSVGYELNYLISRLWISHQQLENNHLIRRYYWVTKIIPTAFLIIIGLLYFSETIFFFSGISVGGAFLEGFFKFLWDSSILGFLIIFLVAGWLLNYYLAASIKKQVEQKYVHDTAQTLATNLDYFQFDFKVALQYDQAIWIPYLLTWGSNQEKWLGAFVY